MFYLINISLFYGIITCMNRKCAESLSDKEMLPHGVNLINMITHYSLTDRHTQVTQPVCMQLTSKFKKMKVA